MIADSAMPSVPLSAAPVGSATLPIPVLSENLQTLHAPRSSQPPRLRMEVLRGSDGLAKLAPHWDRLLEQSAVRTPFMRWDWAELWWKHFGPEFQAVFGAAWAPDGTLLALVPFCIGPGHNQVRRRLRILSFFAGSGEVVAEGLDFMVVHGHEETLGALVDHVFESIKDEWDIAHFGYVDERSAFYSVLQSALEKHGASAQSVNLQESPMICLEDGCWERYLMKRTANFRKKIRRHWTAAKRDHQMVIRELECGADAGWFMDHLHRLHGLRWSERESLFLRQRSKLFHRELAARWAASGRMVLLVMEFGGSPVAANYAFIEGDSMWDYQGGWDMAHIDLSPAKLVNSENVRRAIARGVRMIDMLPGDLEYKSKWTQTFRKVADLEAANPTSVRANIFQSIRTVKKSLSKLFPGGASQP